MIVANIGVWLSVQKHLLLVWCQHIINLSSLFWELLERVWMNECEHSRTSLKGNWKKCLDLNSFLDTEFGTVWQHHYHHSAVLSSWRELKFHHYSTFWILKYIQRDIRDLNGVFGVLKTSGVVWVVSVFILYALHDKEYKRKWALFLL